MLQLALRQQQLHAAHMQIKLQHQTNLVVGEHNVQHLHHIQHNQQQEQQQRGTLFAVDQLGSPALSSLGVPASDELNVAACCSATGATWLTQHEPHVTMSTTSVQTTLTTADQRPLQTSTQVCMPLCVLLDRKITIIHIRLHYIDQELAYIRCCMGAGQTVRAYCEVWRRPEVHHTHCGWARG